MKFNKKIKFGILGLGRVIEKRIAKVFKKQLTNSEISTIFDNEKEKKINLKKYLTVNHQIHQTTFFTLAGITAGADSVIIEVHLNPKNAVVDPLQPIDYDGFGNLIKEIDILAKSVFNRSIIQKKRYLIQLLIAQRVLDLFVSILSLIKLAFVPTLLNQFSGLIRTTIFDRALISVPYLLN